MTKQEIIETLSDCINIADQAGNFEIGDKLFEVINALNDIFGLDPNENEVTK